jgi:hydroxyacyl-ACP dehydratase HTD2-like protein with hotdog domain
LKKKLSLLETVNNESNTISNINTNISDVKKICKEVSTNTEIETLEDPIKLNKVSSNKSILNNIENDQKTTNNNTTNTNIDITTCNTITNNSHLIHINNIYKDSYNSIKNQVTISCLMSILNELYIVMESLFISQFIYKYKVFIHIIILMYIIINNNNTYNSII